MRNAWRCSDCGVLFEDRPIPRCVMCGGRKIEELEEAEGAEAEEDDGEIRHADLIRFCAALVDLLGSPVLHVTAVAISQAEGKVLWMNKDENGNVSAWLVADERGH